MTNFKTILFRMLKIFISAVLIAITLQRIGISRIIMQLSEANWLWLGFALAAFTLSYLLGSYQWMLLLHAQSISITWKQTVSFYYVGLFFNNFLISNLGGDIFRMVDVKKFAGDGSGAVSTVLLDRVLGLLVLSALAIVTAPYWMGRTMPGYLIVLLAILTGGWIVLVLLLFHAGVARILSQLAFRIVPEKARLRIRAVYLNLRRLGSNSHLMGRLLLVSTVIQCLRIFMHYLVARSLDVSLSPLYFLVIIPIIAIVSSLPVSLGGLGVREQTGILLFGSLGIAALKAFSIEFIAYLVAVISSLPGGIHYAVRRSVEARAKTEAEHHLVNKKGLS